MVYNYIVWMLMTVFTISGALVVDTMQRLSKVLRVIGYTIFWLFMLIGVLSSSPLVYIDSIQIVFLVLCTIACIAISLYSEGYLRLLYGKIQYLQLIIDMSLILIFMLFTARTLLEFTVLWISVELVGFLLILLERGLGNWNIGLKYLMVCVTAGDVSLFSWIAVASMGVGDIGRALLSDFDILASQGINALNPFLTLLLLIGFLAKLGQVPLHIWLIDTYTEAPSPITAIFSGLMSKMGVYAILRLFATVNLNPLASSMILISVGLITTVYAAVMASAQTDIKRMIAYSSMSHYGAISMLLGLLSLVGAVDVAGKQGLESLIRATIYVYVLYHGLLKTHIFLNIASIELLTNTRDVYRLGYLSRVAGDLYGKIIYTVMALMGVPPTIGFIVKALLLYLAFTLVLAGLPQALVFLAGIAVSSIFSIVYSVKYLGAYVAAYANTPYRPTIKLDGIQYAVEGSLAVLMVLLPFPLFPVLPHTMFIYILYGVYVAAIAAISAVCILGKKLFVYESPVWVGGVEA